MAQGPAPTPHIMVHADDGNYYFYGNDKWEFEKLGSDRVSIKVKKVPVDVRAKGEAYCVAGTNELPPNDLD